MENKIIAYDVASLPRFERNGQKMTVVDIMDIKNDSGYLFFDSKFGNAPKVLDGTLDCKIVDYNILKWQVRLKMIVRTMNKRILIKKLRHDT